MKTMWLYRDLDERLMLIQSTDPPIYDDETERWVIDCDLMNKPFEITDCETLEEFEGIKFGDKPIQVLLVKLT